MPAAARSPQTRDNARRKVEITISVQTILLVAGVAALAWALASIAAR